MTNTNNNVIKLLALFICVSCVLAALSTIGNYTRKDCKVVEIIGNDVYVVDASGNEWIFEGKGYRVGDIVDLKMNENGTPNNIKDDTIKAVK